MTGTPDVWFRNTHLWKLLPMFCLLLLFVLVMISPASHVFSLSHGFKIFFLLWQKDILSILTRESSLLTGIIESFNQGTLQNLCLRQLVLGQPTQPKETLSQKQTNNQHHPMSYYSYKRKSNRSPSYLSSSCFKISWKATNVMIYSLVFFVHGKSL